MASEKYLIVNGDDFGLSHGVNRGIIQAHEEGIVTSASLMVRGPAAEEAAAYARAHPEMSVGLHIDLGEWVYRGGEWVPLYEVVPLDDERAFARQDEERFLAVLAVVHPDPLARLEDVDVDAEVREPPLALEVAVRTEWAFVLPA